MIAPGCAYGQFHAVRMTRRLILTAGHLPAFLPVRIEDRLYSSRPVLQLAPDARGIGRDVALHELVIPSGAGVPACRLFEASVERGDLGHFAEHHTAGHLVGRWWSGGGNRTTLVFENYDVRAGDSGLPVFNVAGVFVGHVVRRVQVTDAAGRVRQAARIEPWSAVGDLVLLAAARWRAAHGDADNDGDVDLDDLLAAVTGASAGASIENVLAHWGEQL